MRKLNPGANVRKHFVRNLQILVVNSSFCLWQAFPALSNVCKCAQICANMRKYVQICANMCKYAQICVNMCKYVHIYVRFGMYMPNCSTSQQSLYAKLVPHVGINMPTCHIKFIPQFQLSLHFSPEWEVITKIFQVYIEHQVHKIDK